MSEERLTPGTVRPGGRTARTRAAVLAAAFDELGDGSYSGLTMEKIAQRAGVHLATIYRRWGSVERIICELLTDQSAKISLPDTGSLRGDLRALALGIGRFYGAARNRSVIEAVVAAAVRDPYIDDMLRDFFHERRCRAATLVQQAIERGELPAHTNASELIAALAAPFYYRLLISRGEIDQELAETTAAATYEAARAGVFTIPAPADPAPGGTPPAGAPSTAAPDEPPARLG
ncbi:TetR/AcrR family transcriptional regulator [Streptomyces zagrosensis]|uniref:AcrR family transcriptional regulator n=1 Tax=Streptomyces zagrosensis TaxID=1042984 RepID=A0A7W9Q802_9ACTN|nr:TetR/AcrR family transcriptional regulator [Streptomyces zagrosensis]MBB5934252.1 AcrR family transcriptional regulator [Streptomyces zagrosensis]